MIDSKPSKNAIPRKETEQAFLKALTKLSNEFGIYIVGYDDSFIYLTDKKKALNVAESRERRKLGVGQIKHNGELEYVGTGCAVSFRVGCCEIVKTHIVGVE